MTPEQLLQQLVAAERDAALPAKAVQSGWERLASADLSAAQVPAATGAPLGGGALAAAGKGAALGVGIGAVAIGGATGWGWLASPPSPPAGEPPPAVTVSAPVRHAPPQSPVAVETLPEAPASAVPSANAGPRVAAPPREEATYNLQAETALLRQAKSALDRGQPASAEVWLAEHEARFPRGSLTSEREGLRVVVACSNSEPQAVARARRFLAGTSGSLLAQRIERACFGSAQPDPLRKESE